MGNTSSEEHHLMNKTASGREPLKSKSLIFVRTNYLNIKKLFVLIIRCITVKTQLYINTVIKYKVSVHIKATCFGRNSFHSGC